ncbi:MAG: transcriptional repressor NrdR [Phycisphaerae bacterium]|jgi:transcriptional repressor NrdR|nr:transcriptional repressor NrdR [Phycisphaerae bacterium]
MQCPFCKTANSRVTDTRETDGGATIRRRRECIHCNKRFTTYEKSETIVKLMVVKKDGSRVPYERAKILRGLEKACYKRPVSEAQLESLVDRIEEKLLARYDRELPSRYIGEVAAEFLKEVDEIAYVRFASVYREFRDVGEFIREVHGVINRQGKDSTGQQQLFEENK